MIIAFEGIDGAGKNTLVTAVEQELIAREIAVARLGFPRYEHSVTAKLAQEALHQRMGDLTDSIYGMATLFALDRHDVADELAALDDDGYVILLDRYTASNAAYSAARQSIRDECAAQQENANASLRDRPLAASAPAEHPIVDWVAQLEFEQLGVPVPDLHVLVDVDADVAQQRAREREEEDSSRTRDAYERDSDLQLRTVAAYRGLAESNWHSPWHVVDASDIETARRAEAVADLISQALSAVD